MLRARIIGIGGVTQDAESGQTYPTGDNTVKSERPTLLNRGGASWRKTQTSSPQLGHLISYTGIVDASETKIGVPSTAVFGFPTPREKRHERAVRWV
jgi:hypothetical protein